MSQDWINELSDEQKIMALCGFNPDQPRDKDGKFGSGSGTENVDRSPGGAYKSQGLPAHVKQLAADAHDKIKKAVKLKKAGKTSQALEVIHGIDNDIQEVMVAAQRAGKGSFNADLENTLQGLNQARGDFMASI